MIAPRFRFFFSDFLKKMAQSVSKETLRAERVQKNVLNQQYDIQYEAKLKHKVDVYSTIESLEKEMMKQMAQSLKKSEDKVQFFIKKTNEKYQEHLRNNFNDDQIKKYNEMVKLCEKARWEYIVHRQSCGFTIQNYQIVFEMYKLPPFIPQEKSN